MKHSSGLSARGLRRLALTAFSGLASLLLGSACTSAPAPGSPAGAVPSATQPNGVQPSAAADESSEIREQAYENTVKWSTASEVDSFGFDVYRALSEDGPWELITPAPIEGAGTSDETHHYRFVDDAIDPHQTYYYYVESISMTGFRERFTPIGKTPPKVPPPETTNESDGAP